MNSRSSSSIRTSVSSRFIRSSSTSRSEFLQTSSSTSSIRTNSSRLTGGQEFVNLIKRLDTVLNVLKGQMADFYKNLLNLQKKRDFLVFSINILKHNELLRIMAPADRADIENYIKMLENQLNSVELFASRTTFVDPLKRINELFNSMLSTGDTFKSNDFCEMYLKACRSFPEIANQHRSQSNIFVESLDDDQVEQNTYKLLIQREFEALLTGCTKKDRIDVYERLLAIRKHIKFQISNTT